MLISDFLEYPTIFLFSISVLLLQYRPQLRLKWWSIQNGKIKCNTCACVTIRVPFKPLTECEWNQLGDLILQTRVLPKCANSIQCFKNSNLEKGRFWSIVRFNDIFQPSQGWDCEIKDCSYEFSRAKEKGNSNQHFQIPITFPNLSKLIRKRKHTKTFGNSVFNSCNLRRIKLVWNK